VNRISPNRIEYHPSELNDIQSNRIASNRIETNAAMLEEEYFDQTVLSKIKSFNEKWGDGWECWNFLDGECSEEDKSHVGKPSKK